MKARVTIPIITFVAIVVGGLAVHRCTHTVPLSRCSEVYRQWDHVVGVQATFLHGYRVNDTLALDVTLLQATDSAGWDSLVHQFNIPVFSKEIEDLIKENNSLDYRLAPKGAPCEITSIDDPRGIDLVVIKRQTKNIFIFHLDNPEQRKAIRKQKTYELNN